MNNSELETAKIYGWKFEELSDWMVHCIMIQWLWARDKKNGLELPWYEI